MADSTQRAPHPVMIKALSKRQDAAWIFDAERECMLWGNEAACAFWRAANNEELVSRDYSSDMSDATRSRLRATLAAVRRGENSYEQWTLYPDRAGAKTSVIRATRAELTDGGVAILFSLEHARSAADEALRGVEAVRHTTVVITLFDHDARTVLYANPSALMTYGQVDAMRGLVGRFADHDLGERVIRDVDAGRSVSLETRVHTLAGLRWHGMDARRTVDPVTGQPAVLVNEKDITAAKLAEEALREAGADLERRVSQRTAELEQARGFVDMILDTIDSVVLVADDEGRITRANRRATGLLGHRGELLGQDIFEVAGLDASACITWDEPVEVEIASPSGPQRLVWTVSRSRREDSREVVLTGVDITRRRDLQLQLQLADRMASLGTLAAGVAHELNNPLAVIRANLEFLRTALSDAESDVRSAVNDSLGGTARASRIVADLSAYSSADDVRSLELAHMVDSSVSLAAGPLHDVAVEVQVPEGLYVMGAEGPLTQVLLNLLVNGAQAMSKDGAAMITVSAEARGSEVVVAVTDSGTGISEEDAARAFDPFFTTKGLGEGTGLGLYVCQRIIHGHGGDIRIAHQGERGTRVTFTLPSASPPSTATEAPEVHASGHRILVVDDDRGICRALKRLLRDHDVAVATSAHEALSLLRAEPDRFSAVLCDVMMPELSGVDLFRHIQDDVPYVASRFIFMSGGVYQSEMEAFIEGVPNPMLSKPLDVAALRRALDEVVGTAP